FMVLRRYAVSLDPHSFPTRRSSDLWPCRHGKVQWLSLENFMGNAPPGPGMGQGALVKRRDPGCHRRGLSRHRRACEDATADWGIDRKSTRLNSSHVKISYAVFCLRK